MSPGLGLGHENGQEGMKMRKSGAEGMELGADGLLEV